MRWPSTTCFACLAALAGCGGEDEPVRTVKVPPNESVLVKGDEYSFDPGRIEMVADPSRDMQLALKNEGSLAHNLKILDGERELGGVQSFPAGETRRFAVRLTPGAYTFVCTVADHRQLGMTGELEVSAR